MRIAIDAMRAVAPNWGGIENYNYYLIQALSRVADHHDLFLLANTPQHSRPLPAGINIHYKTIKPSKLWTQLGLSHETFSTPYDVLLMSGQNAPLVYNWSVPTVVVFHDLSPFLFPRQYRFPGILYLLFFGWWAARRATRIIAVSEATKKDLVKLLHVPEEKVKVIPEAYDNEIFYPYSEAQAAPILRKHELTRPFILFVGTVQPRKNIVRLINAFAQVKKNLNFDLELVIVGKPGWKNEEIYYEPSRIHISKDVRFLGHVPDEDLPALLSSARVLAYPSLFEGFGLVPLEAMACGTPVLCSNVSSLPEVVGDAALLVDPYSVESIAEGLSRLLNDEALAQELRQSGLKHCTKYSWDRAARETLSVLEEAGELA